MRPTLEADGSTCSLPAKKPLFFKQVGHLSRERQLPVEQIFRQDEYSRNTSLKLGTSDRSVPPTQAI